MCLLVTLLSYIYLCLCVKGILFYLILRDFYIAQFIKSVTFVAKSHAKVSDFKNANISLYN